MSLVSERHQQEIVDRSSWRRRNSMVFVISGNGQRMAKSFDGDKAHAPLLRIEFSFQNPIKLPPEQPIEFVKRIDHSLDDAKENIEDHNMTLYGKRLQLVEDIYRHQIYGLRFGEIDVPKRSHVVEAYIEFTVDKESTERTSLTIRGQASDDAKRFGANFWDITDRPLTSTTVHWDNIPEWRNVGSIQRSPGVGSLVQEIVDRPGWSQRNAIVFVISGSGTRFAKSFDGDRTRAPLLRIEYVPPAGPLNPPKNPPTKSPTSSPTDPPTKAPTESPTKSPTDHPSLSPTDPPTNQPTNPPTKSPTEPPTLSPTDPPTKSPTDSPILFPTDRPTHPPTAPPTKSPTPSPPDPPTHPPTDPPTSHPTVPPTNLPTDPPTATCGDGNPTVSCGDNPVPIGQTGEWNLIFADDFDGSSIARAKWATTWFSNSFFSSSLDEVDISCYHPSQVFVGNGNLDLTVATSTHPSCVKADSSPAPYVSGLVHTRETFSFTYGYVEARILLPNSNEDRPFRPAFWTTGPAWPMTGEIDIMQGVEGSEQPCFRYHWGQPEYHDSFTKCSRKANPGKWHTYGVLWEEDKITAFYDGIKLVSHTNGVASTPHYLVLNLGMRNITEQSGSMEQIPAGDGLFGNDAGPVVQGTIAIDYVRVWSPPSKET